MKCCGRWRLGKIWLQRSDPPQVHETCALAMSVFGKPTFGNFVSRTIVRVPEEFDAQASGYLCHMVRKVDEV